MKYNIILFISLVFSTYCHGQFGNAILMNGENAYITVPDNRHLNQTSTMTIEAWINPCDVSDIHDIANKNWCKTSQNAYSFRVRDGQLEWVWSNKHCRHGANTYRSTDAVIDRNTWSHVAAVHTETGVTMYLNGLPISGMLVTGDYGKINKSSEPLRIGAYKNFEGNLSSFYIGMMDEVRIWNFALDAASIQSRFDTELTGDESGLVCYLNMNDKGVGFGINVANDATITGSTLSGNTRGSTTSPKFVSHKKTQCSGKRLGFWKRLMLLLKKK